MASMWLILWLSAFIRGCRSDKMEHSYNFLSSARVSYSYSFSERASYNVRPLYSFRLPPTMAPSRYPPSPLPTLSLSEFWAKANSALDEFSKNTSLAVYYQESFEDGAIRSSSSWKNVTTKIARLDSENIVEAFHVGVVTNPVTSLRPVEHFVCKDSRYVSLLWNALIYSQSLKISCSGLNVTVSKCRGGSACLRLHGNESQPQDGDGISYPSSRYQLMAGFSVKRKLSTWPQWTQSCVANGTTSIAVTLNVSSAGIVRCGVVPSYDASSVNIPPPPADYYGLINRKSAFGFTNFKSTLSLTQLSANTSYFVYCFPESFNNNPSVIFRASSSTIKERACLVQTARSEITVQLAWTQSSGTILIGKPYPFSAVVTSRVGGSMTVTPTAYRISYAACNYSSGMNSHFNASEMLIESAEINFSPRSQRFVNQEVTSSFYVQFSTSGCFAVTLRTDPPDVKVVASSNIAFLGLDQYLVLNAFEVPTHSSMFLSTASFVFTGSSMQLRFSFETDRGATVGLGISTTKFTCQNLFNFSSAWSSICQFTSSSAVMVTLPVMSNLSLPNVGDLVSVKGGLLYPRCTARPDQICSYYTPMLESSARITSSVVMKPQVIISAPRIMTLGHNLSLGIMLSSGNCGRRWKSMEWSVFFNETKANNLEEYLISSNYSQIGCAPGTIGCNLIPAALVSQIGIYTFTVRLTNFLGSSSIGSASIMVTEEKKCTTVSILGPRERSVDVASKFTLESLVVSDSACSDVISYSWHVFVDNKLTSDILVDVATDLRKLTVPNQRLVPGTSYRFKLAAISGLVASYDEVRVFALPSTLKASIHGALNSTLSISNSLILDASASSLSDLSDPDSLLYFRWSCIQIDPMSATGCDLFHRALDDFVILNTTDSTSKSWHSPSIYIPIAGSVLNASATYRFTVTVFAIEYNLISSSVVSITTIDDPDSLPFPSVQVVTPQKVDLASSAVVDAWISFDVPFVATWRLPSLNRTFTSLSFPGGNEYYAPFVFRQFEFPRMLSFQLELTVRAIDPVAGSPFDGYVTIEVNEYPRYGSVSTRPTSGSDETIFMIFATNWQDVDIPLTYAFFQTQSVPMDWMIRQRAQLSYVLSELNPAFVDQGNRTNVVARVFDFYGCSNEAETFVSVSPAPLRKSSEVLIEVQGSLASATRKQDTDKALRVTNDVITLLESPSLNCSSTAIDEIGAPNVCTQLVHAGAVAASSILRWSGDGDVDTVATLTTSLDRFVSNLQNSETNRTFDVCLDLFGALSELDTLISVDSIQRKYLISTMVHSADTFVKKSLQWNVTNSLEYLEVFNRTKNLLQSNLKTVLETSLIGMNPGENFTAYHGSYYEISAGKGWVVDSASNDTLSGLFGATRLDMLETAAWKDSIANASSFAYYQLISSVPPVEKEEIAVNSDIGVDKDILSDSVAIQVFLTSSRAVGTTTNVLVDARPFPWTSLADFNRSFINISSLTASFSCNGTDQLVIDGYFCSENVTNGPAFQFDDQTCETQSNGLVSQTIDFHCPYFDMLAMCSNTDSGDNCEIVSTAAVGITPVNVQCLCPMSFTAASSDFNGIVAPTAVASQSRAVQRRLFGGSRVFEWHGTFQVTSKFGRAIDPFVALLSQTPAQDPVEGPFGPDSVQVTILKYIGIIIAAVGVVIAVVYRYRLYLADYNRYHATDVVDAEASYSRPVEDLSESSCENNDSSNVVFMSLEDLRLQTVSSDLESGGQKSEDLQESTFDFKSEGCQPTDEKQAAKEVDLSRDNKESTALALARLVQSNSPRQRREYSAVNTEDLPRAFPSQSVPGVMTRGGVRITIAEPFLGDFA